MDPRADRDTSALPPPGSGGTGAGDALAGRFGEPGPEVWFPVPDNGGVGAIAEGFARGDMSSLAEAYRRWGGLVYTTAARALGSTRAAEDVTRRTFVGAWRSRGGFDPGAATLPGWLFEFARVEVAAALGARRGEAGEPDGRDGLPVPVGRPVAERFDGVADRVLVLHALSLLPGEQQGILRLAFYDDLPPGEIADRLGLPRRTVRSRIRRSLELLEQELGGGRSWSTSTRRTWPSWPSADRPPTPRTPRRGT